MKKIKLTQLTVQSFVTAVSKEDQDAVKGGAQLTGTETRQCPTLPINICVPTIERCTAGITSCC